MTKELVIQQMKHIFKEQPLGITHSLNVLEHAISIMNGENVTIEEKT